MNLHLHAQVQPHREGAAGRCRLVDAADRWGVERHQALSPSGPAARDRPPATGRLGYQGPGGGGGHTGPVHHREAGRGHQLAGVR